VQYFAYSKKNLLLYNLLWLVCPDEHIIRTVHLPRDLFSLFVFLPVFNGTLSFRTVSGPASTVHLLDQIDGRVQTAHDGQHFLVREVQNLYRVMPVARVNVCHGATWLLT
jgi:hypothetical protein